MIDSDLIDMLLQIRNSLNILINTGDDCTKMSQLLNISNAIDNYIDALESKK